MRETFDTKKFLKEVEIDDTNINGELSKNASMFAYYGQQRVFWKTFIDTINLEIDTVTSKLTIELKDEVGKKYTVGDIDARVTINEDIQRLRKGLIIAKNQHDLYSNAAIAIEKKGINCQSINKTTGFYTGGVMPTSTITHTAPWRGEEYGYVPSMSALRTKVSKADLVKRVEGFTTSPKLSV